jgi:hypothetical protein
VYTVTPFIISSDDNRCARVPAPRRQPMFCSEPRSAHRRSNVRSGATQNLPQLVLRANGASDARTRPDDANTLAEQRRALTPRARARGPIDRILQYAGDTAVVFGTRQKQSIDRVNRPLPSIHRWGIALCFNVLIKQRQIMQIVKFDLHAGRRKLTRRAQQGCIERALA